MQTGTRRFPCRPAVCVTVALLVALGLIALLHGPATVSAQVCSWAGTWSSPANGTFTLTQNGPQVSGGNGGAYGLSGTVSGAGLTGFWTYGSDRGAFSITIDGSCNSFLGLQGLNGSTSVTAATGEAFTGTRVGGVPGPSPSTSTGGGCSQWNISGTWQLTQSNGYAPTLNLQQSGTAISGTMTFSASDQAKGNYVSSSGGLTGTLTGNQFQFTTSPFAKRDGTTSQAQYSGTVSAGQISNGTAVDLANTYYKATWSATGPATCAGSTSPSSPAGPAAGSCPGQYVYTSAGGCLIPAGAASSPGGTGPSGTSSTPGGSSTGAGGTSTASGGGSSSSPNGASTATGNNNLVTRFYGSVQDSSGAPVQGTVVATVAATPCGTGTSSSGFYTVDVSPIAGCTSPGATVCFTVGGQPAQTTGTLPSANTFGTAVSLNLILAANGSGGAAACTSQTSAATSSSPAASASPSSSPSPSPSASPAPPSPIATGPGAVQGISNAFAWDFSDCTDHGTGVTPTSDAQQSSPGCHIELQPSGPAGVDFFFNLSGDPTSGGGWTLLLLHASALTGGGDAPVHVTLNGQPVFDGPPHGNGNGPGGLWAMTERDVTQQLQSGQNVVHIQIADSAAAAYWLKLLQLSGAPSSPPSNSNVSPSVTPGQLGF